MSDGNGKLLLGEDDVLVDIDILQHQLATTEINTKITTADDVKLSEVEAIVILYQHLGAALVKLGLDPQKLPASDVNVSVI